MEKRSCSSFKTDSPKDFQMLLDNFRRKIQQNDIVPTSAKAD